jgi:hypothetical protein
MAPATAPVSVVGGVLADYQLRRAVAALKAGTVSRAQLAATFENEAEPPPSYTALLRDKDAVCRSILQSYGASLTVANPTAFNEAQAAIEAWKNDHASVWQQIRDKVLPTDATVSQADALVLPAPLLRAYVEALYQDANAGLSMYTNGVWEAWVADGTYSATFVRDDATARLDLYDTIVLMHETGALASAYQGAPPQRGLLGVMGALRGFGTLGSLGSPIAAGEAILIVLGVVAAILAVGFVITSIMTTRTNNLIAQKCCDKYLETKDDAYKDCCKQQETDARVIAKYGIATAGLVLFGYLLVGRLPEIKKALTS